MSSNQALASRQHQISFAWASADDLEDLVALRIEAMRESLERMGLFNPVRARERLVNSFSPAHTRHILSEGQRAGFFVLKPTNGALLLDHLYIRPGFQGQGVGAAALALVCEEADAAGLPVRLGALRQSDANRFYQRHGFNQVDEGEWDIYYVRLPRTGV